MGLSFMLKKNTMLLTDEKQQIEEFSEAKFQNSEHKTHANTEG
jgi:hypothetical protein